VTGGVGAKVTSLKGTGRRAWVRVVGARILIVFIVVVGVIVVVHIAITLIVV
jgi:hypothetical protein